MKKTKILLLAPQKFPPRHVDVSVLIGEKLPQYGYKTDALMQAEAVCGQSYSTTWGSGTAYVACTNDATTLWGRCKRFWNNLVNDAKVLPLAKKNLYACIIAKDKFFGGIIALLAAKLTKTPFIFWLSFPYPEDFLCQAMSNSGIKRLTLYSRFILTHFVLYHILLPCSTHIFAQSAQMKNDLAAEGASQGKMTVLPMGIAKMPESDTSIRSGQLDRPFALYLGTLNYVRNLDFLVRVMAEVIKEKPEVQLFFIGKGVHPQDEAILRTEINRLQLSDTVKLLGFMPFAEAAGWISRASVCLSPYYPSFILNSTSPTKLIEYMAYGKAVVANEHPEQSLILKESKAGLCVPWEEKAFARAIITLVNNPEEAKAMGQRGREYVKNTRTYDIIAADFVKSLEKVISQ